MSDEAKRLLCLPSEAQVAPATQSLPAPLAHLVHDSLASGKPVSGHDVDLQTEERGTVTARVSITPLGAGPREQGAVIVVNDITSAKRLQQNFRHFDRLASIGTLSASMAHEIRNALVAGKTCFDLLFEKHRDADLVGVARREIRRIDAIVSRMLKFVGSPEPAFGAVRLHEVLEHSLQLVEPQLRGKLISVKRSFRASSDRVNGDDLQLQQAFVNLFLNAMEAMGPSGTLTVATEIVSPGAATDSWKGIPAESQIGLTIQDTGAGIPAEHLARLFEPFFTTKANGTGLGLPITRRILQEHRGDITVQSKPDKGTTFRIILPVLDTPS
jgi:two-component system, NtrC family, sensor histidine kinase HydH